MSLGEGWREGGREGGREVKLVDKSPCEAEGGREGGKEGGRAGLPECFLSKLGEEDGSGGGTKGIAAPPSFVG